MSDFPARVSLEPNLGEWEKAARSLLRPEELRQVFANAINRTLAQGKTEGLREVTRQFTIKRTDINKGVRVINASKNQDDPGGLLEFRGPRNPLMKFIVRPSGGFTFAGKRKNARPSLFVQIRKDGGGTVSNPLFVANMGRGPRVYSRRGEAKFPVRGETGPSIVSMVGNDRAVQTIRDKMSDVLQSRIDHEVSRMMSK
jgi:hypothetical protein